MTKKSSKKKIKKDDGDIFSNWPDENSDAEHVGKSYAGTTDGKFSFDKHFETYRRNRFLLKIGSGLYFSAVPFIFGVIVNITGDYLTASVIAASLIMGPVGYKFNTRLY